MKQNSSTKLTGWKMLVIAMMLMAATNVNAQHHPPPPPPPINWDSVLHAHVQHLDSLIAHLDSAIVHHPHDTLPAPPPVPIHHRDTIVFHPDTAFRPRPDTIPPGHSCHRDSIPTPVFPPDTGRGGGHDTLPTPPLPPDTSTTGGHRGHDTIPTPPPFHPDSGWTGGGRPDTLAPPHKDLLVGADNDPASISIFPNPVVSTSIMRIQNTSNTVTFRLYDMNGRVALELNNLSNGDMNFSKGNLTPGIYLYEMIDGNTKAATGRVLIQ